MTAVLSHPRRTEPPAMSEPIAALLAEMHAANARVLVDVHRAGIRPADRARVALDAAAERLRLTLVGYAQLLAPDADSRDEIARVWRELAAVLAARVTLDGGTLPAYVYLGPSRGPDAPPVTRVWRYTHPNHEGDRLRMGAQHVKPQLLAFDVFGGGACPTWALVGEVDPATGETTPWSSAFYREGVYVARGNPDYRPDAVTDYRLADGWLDADSASAAAVDGEAA